MLIPRSCQIGDAGHGPECGFPLAEEGDRLLDDADVDNISLNGAPGSGEKKKVKASDTTAMLVITGMNPIVRNTDHARECRS